MENESQSNGLQGIIHRFILCQSCIFLLPLFSTYLHPRLLGNIRNFQLLLILIFLLIFFKKSIQTSQLKEFIWSNRLWKIFIFTSLLSFIGCSFSHFLGLKLNGEDFSIFDWMLYNTNYHQFMTSPICNMAEPLGVCQHFAIHPTYIMIPFAYLHRIFPNPSLLILVHSLTLWSAIFPLRRIAKLYLEHDILVLAVLLAFLSNAYVGSILNHGFHVEVFFIPLGLWFIHTWERKSILCYGFLALFLSIKEDAAFYAISFIFAQVLRNRQDFQRCSFMILMSLTILLMNLMVVQPHFLQKTQAVAPSYLRFWNHLGPSKADIIGTMLTAPGYCLQLILTSHWYILIGCLLFIPLLSFGGLAGMLPALVIYGLSNLDQMREYATYYSAPLLAFLFYGLIDGSRILLQKQFFSTNTAFKLIIFACLLFSLSGGGYQKFPPLAFSALQDLKQARLFLAEQNPDLICAQTLLFPHLSYAFHLQPLSAICMHQGAAYSIILNNPQYNSYPLGAAELTELVNTIPNTRLLKVYASGLQIYQKL